MGPGKGRKYVLAAIWTSHTTTAHWPLMEKVAKSIYHIGLAKLILNEGHNLGKIRLPDILTIHDLSHEEGGRRTRKYTGWRKYKRRSDHVFTTSSINNNNHCSHKTRLAMRSVLTPIPLRQLSVIYNSTLASPLHLSLTLRLNPTLPLGWTDALQQKGNPIDSHRMSWIVSPQRTLCISY